MVISDYILKICINGDSTIYFILQVIKPCLSHLFGISFTNLMPPFEIFLKFTFLLQNSFYYFTITTRLRVMLTITLSELMSDVQVTQMKPSGSLEESGEARRLRKSLEEMADHRMTVQLINDCGLPGNALEAFPENSTDNLWSWSEVKYLSDSLLQALDAALEHAVLV